MSCIICKKQATGFLLHFGFILFLVACSTRAKQLTDKREKFQVINPVMMDTIYNKEYIAEIQATQNVEVRAKVKGFIEKIYVDEGKPVSAGQVLFSISSQEFREELLKANAQLKSAMAELKMAEVTARNTALLVDKNIVSKSELEMSKAKIDAIKASIEEAQSAISVAKLNLSFTEVRAPFSGIINRIPLKVGSLLEEGALLTTISNNNEVFAYFNVSEKEYLEFIKSGKGSKHNQDVSLLLADDSLFNHKGSIETIESEIDKNTGNIAFRARFPNPEHLLKHGASAKVLVMNDLNNAMIIPQKSTFEIQEKVYVYVLDSNDKAHMKSIDVKLRLPNIYVVESGLNPNDKIIYEGSQLIKEGDQIAPDLLSMNEAFAKNN